MRMEESILLILILTSQSCVGQEKAAGRHVSPVDFFKEEITLAVSDSFASVSGRYYFRNNTGRGGTMPVLFPFYVDTLSLFPDTIGAFVINGTDTTNLEFRNSEAQNAIIISIPLNPNETTEWHLDYRQKISGSKATYILTSTAAWGKPLEEATYQFIVPDSFKDISAWPEADTVIEEGNKCVYRAQRINFMPTRNMELEWEVKSIEGGAGL
jgi:hypothetical protein